MPYSMDYRRAVARAYDECGSSIEMAEQFGCSRSWVRRLIQQQRERGTLEPQTTARPDDQRRYNDTEEAAIRELIAAKPDATLAEVAAAIGKPAHPATVCRTLARLKLVRKKKTHTAEQQRPDVAAARAVWFEPFKEVRVDQLLFLDEFGATTTMQRTHGRAAPGERVVAAVPHGHWRGISTIAAMTTAGIVASASFDGATDADTFIPFVQEALVPILRPGQVLDDLPAHKVSAVKRLIESTGTKLLPLPPDSPDLNPIEMALSKIKRILRQLTRRTAAELLEGISDALARITPGDALAYLAHCGYAVR